LKKAKDEAKLKMHIKKLHGFKIETDLDEKLCRHLGRLNYVGVSEKKYRRKGWL